MFEFEKFLMDQTIFILNLIILIFFGGIQESYDSFFPQLLI
jgi:hypothetical protein